MSEADLSKEGVVYFAHHVIQTMRCEWEGCAIILNSWDTLTKHLFRHCSRVKQQDGVYQCSHSRCSGRFHTSLVALKTHAELSHLSRVALPCPARGCNEVFVRIQLLQSHFEQAHRVLLDKPVSIDTLAPLAILAPPRSLPPLPPLPDHDTWLTSVSMPPIRLGNSQTNASQRISRKWSRLNVQDEESNDDPIPFDDLSSFQPHDIEFTPKLVDIEIRRKLPLARQSLLSRPQPAVYPPPRSTEPEQTILYPAFVRMVDNLVTAGTLAGHKEGRM